MYTSNSFDNAGCSNPSVNSSMPIYQSGSINFGNQSHPHPSFEPPQTVGHRLEKNSRRENVSLGNNRQVMAESESLIKSESHASPFADSSDDETSHKIAAATNQVKSQLFVKYNLSCGNCERRFSSKEELDKHVCSQKQETNVLYECQDCKTLFPSLDELASHMKVHEQHVIVTGSDSLPQLTRIGYTCRFCDKVLSSKGSLAKHQELHKGLKPYECSFCGKSFSLKGNRDKHQLIHSGNRPFQCMLCLKTFTLKGNLQQHELTHSSTKLFKCTICERDFTLKGNLDKHVKRHLVGMVKPRSSTISQKKKKHMSMVDERIDEELHSRNGEDRDEYSQNSSSRSFLASGVLQLSHNLNAGEHSGGKVHAAGSVEVGSQGGHINRGDTDTFFRRERLNQVYCAGDGRERDSSGQVGKFDNEVKNFDKCSEGEENVEVC